MSKWKVLKSSEIFRNKVLCMRAEECELPDGRVMPRYLVMEFPDWVNIVAVTKDGQAILLDQYRHASREMHVEVPGGSMDPEDRDHLEAARRELLEETGYQSNDWIYCGSHYPNPALQTNQMHTYLALDCEKTSDPKLDPYEDLSVRLMQATDLAQELKKGTFTHSLMIASVYLALSSRPDVFGWETCALPTTGK